MLELDRQLNLNEAVLRDEGPAPGGAVNRDGWRTPSSPWSAISPLTRNCASPPRARPSRRSPLPPRRASSTVRPMSGRTATRCSCAARSGVRRPRTWPSPLQRGMRVVATGRLKQRSFENPRGREAHRHRARRRRGRPIASLRLGQGQPGRAGLIDRRRLRRQRRRWRRCPERAGRRPVGFGTTGE